MPDISAAGRLVRLEFRKVFKGKALYIILAIMAVFGGLAASNSSPGDDPRAMEEMMRMELERGLSELDLGRFGPVLVLMPNGSSHGPPPGIDPQGKPLLDESGQPIPENVEYYKQLYTEYVETAIAALSVPDDIGILDSVMGNTAAGLASMIPMLGTALAVGLFSGDFRGGYRIMVSRGVRRADLMTAKLTTALGLALLLAAVFAVVLFLGTMLSDAAAGGGSVSAATVMNIFGVALLMFVAYMLVGGLVGTVLGAPGSAMGVGLALAFVSATFFFNLTPEDDFLLSFLSPVSLGYNFNSLMYYVWRAGEESSRYRDAGLSIGIILAYAAVFAGLVYSVFSKKQLRG